MGNHLEETGYADMQDMLGAFESAESARSDLVQILQKEGRDMFQATERARSSEYQKLAAE